MPEIRPIGGACVWHGHDMAESKRWQRQLSPLQLAEIDAALRGARARGLRWEAMTAADFPLPSFAPLAEDIRAELENGCGLLLLRGLDPGRYKRDELKLLYAGLCRHIGTLVHSNRGGEIMREIRDVTRDDQRDVGARYGALPDPGKPGAFLSSYARTLTNQLLRFHTDRCDVVALFCIRQAKSGGLSQLCSSPAVHNEMLRHRPERCAALYEPVWRSRFGEEDATDDSSYPLPVWGVPQAEAIDLLHEIAEELSFEMSFRPGDIQFVNNHVIYHARRGFEDDAADGGRLLLRLWMAVPNSRALPDGHEILWRDIAAGALRGGIGQTQTTPVG